ncbi:MAG: glycosyl hydrolase family 28 protein [Acidobacteriota bacterium]|nr:glycosyl hydrolase family 28 protein [Acidobacteriota bacterium]
MTRTPGILLVLAFSVTAHAATLYANDTGAKGDGTTLNTVAIQRAIDTAAPRHDTVSFKPGTYLTGALFLKSGVTFEIPEGVSLTGAQDLADFPELPTRIAGIEMTWPAALINVRDQHDVTITGKGTIDGNGQIWWKAYRDLRAAYEPKDLRWASDYDSKRVRLSLIQNSSNVHFGGGLLLKRPGFWTVQILYSHDVFVDGLTIRANAPATGTPGELLRGPSTDGIDIDSSHDIDVAHADIDNNDDALCLKSGRDSDGLRVNRPTYNIKVHDSVIRRGAAAITIGSETSGGFHNIEVWNITAEAAVPNGVLFKSAHTRGGTATDIRIHDMDLQGVATPISMTMNWNPSYSYAELPAGTDRKTMPPYWVPLTTPVPAEQGLPHFSHVHIWNVHATGARRAFSVAAYSNAPLTDFKFDHLDIQAASAGSIANARDWTFSDIHLTTTDHTTPTLTDDTNITGLPQPPPHSSRTKSSGVPPALPCPLSLVPSTSPPVPLEHAKRHGRPRDSPTQIHQHRQLPQPRERPEKAQGSKQQRTRHQKPQHLPAAHPHALARHVLR